MKKNNIIVWGMLTTITLGIGIIIYPSPPPPKTLPAPKISLTEIAEQVGPLLVERRYQDAITALEEAALLYPSAPEPLIRIGQIYLSQHRWLMAEDAFNRALARDYYHPQALAGLGETLLEQGRIEPAITVWGRAVAEDSQYNTGLGRSYLAVLNFDQAETIFARQPDAEAHWYLAALTAPTDVVQAKTHLEAMTVVEDSQLAINRDYLQELLKPFFADSPQNEVAQAVGIGLAQVEQWPLAYQALANIPNDKPAPQQAEAIAFLAHTHIQLGLPAFELFEQAYQLNPESALVLSLQGRYFQQHGAWRSAEHRLGQAVMANQDNPATYAEMATLKAQRGFISSAEAWYEVAILQASNKLPFQRMLAYFYLNHNYQVDEKGIPLVKTMLETHEDSTELQDLLGWMQFITGNNHEAEQTLRQALEQNPDSVRVRYHLAKVLIANHKTEEAIIEFQHVIDWDTSSGLRERAQFALQSLG